jgi:hypothetical protein
VKDPEKLRLLALFFDQYDQKPSIAADLFSPERGDAVQQDLRRMADDLVRAKKVLTDVTDLDPFDYEQGECHWCKGGWELVPGPRGGKGKYQHTGKHFDNCAFKAAKELANAIEA